MKFLASSLDGVCIIEPAVYADARGFFTETYHRERYRAAGFAQLFVQDNLSFSVGGTLRGLHYQHPHDQAKLIMVVKGEIFDVAVDIRRGSPRFGQWVGVSPLRGQQAPDLHPGRLCPRVLCSERDGHHDLQM